METGLGHEVRIHRKRKPVLYPYMLHNILLTFVDQSKYLDVTISKDVNWDPHMNNITSKANNTTHLIKTNVKTNSSQIQGSDYKTYVRPQVEYCCTIWCFWQNKYHIHIVETV